MKEDENNDTSLEERVSITDGLKEVGRIVSNDEEFEVQSDDEVLENMRKDLEKRISRCTDTDEKAELNKELLILEILILQREKIDKEAAVILNDGDAFGLDLDNYKAKEKRKKERDKKQKALLDKLNELGISNLNIEITAPQKSDGRERGGMEKEQRTR